MATYRQHIDLIEREDVMTAKENKGKIVFVTGTSGTGRSTLAFELRKLNFKNIKAYDMDDCGVPEDVDEKWRQDRTVELLEEAIKNKNNGITSIICGVSVPSEIKMSKSYSDDLEVVFGILEISEQTIRDRLNKRKWEEKLIDANVNWANYLHNAVEGERLNFFIDSEKNTPLQVAQKVLEEIGYVKEKGLQI